jgi:hypothetical protein
VTADRAALAAIPICHDTAPTPLFEHNVANQKMLIHCQQNTALIVNMLFTSNMFQFILHAVIATKPIPVALRSKAYVRSSLIARVAGLNPAECIDFRFLCLLCVV